MRTIFFGTLLFVGISWRSAVATPIPADVDPIADPSEEQIAAAKDEYAKLGAEPLVPSDPTKKPYVLDYLIQKTHSA